MLRRSDSAIVAPSLSSDRLQVAHLLGELLDLGVARREFLLELLLRALGGRRLAEQALGVDEADLVVGGGRGAGARTTSASATTTRASAVRFNACLHVDVGLPSSECRARLELEALHRDRLRLAR